MYNNSNKIKIYTERKNVHRQNCECAGVLCTDGGLMSYLQMYSPGVCYVLFRWDMGGGGGGGGVGTKLNQTVIDEHRTDSMMAE